MEFTLLPDPEIVTGVLMSELFGHLHLALVEHGAGEIGVSFPQANDVVGLGNVLRIHSANSRLLVIKKALRLGALVGYMEVIGPRGIPADVTYLTVRRVQAKSSPARLRRRLMRRHGMSLAQAAAQVPDKAKEMLKLPFINLKSASTDQPFPLFIKQGEQQLQSQFGRFSSYGLSATATVPWF